MNDISVNNNITPGIIPLYTLRGHEGVIRWITWSPDGEHIASASEDQTIRLWNSDTGQHYQTLVGHVGSVFCVAWSPDGKVLASGSYDNTVRLWDAQNGSLLQTLTGHSDWVYSVAWSPDGKVLASGSGDNTIRLWNIQRGQPLRTLTGHSDWVYSVAWSPGGQELASSSNDRTIRLWNIQTGQPLRTLTGHSGAVRSVVWSPDGKVLASGSDDHSIRLWNPKIGWQTNILEGQAGAITCVSFSWEGSLLASKSLDGTIHIWQTGTCQTIAILNEPASIYLPPGLAFHPKSSILATLSEKDMAIRVWGLDITTILSATESASPVHYTNAKIVLVGDSGVGKSGLSLVLTGQPFLPTESTHGRRVLTFDNQEIEIDSSRKETRETLLWDLAGQPGYRLIHQLHLSEVALALLVFDAHSETDPFAGVQHWERALRLAERIQGDSDFRMKKFLVAARTDRYGKPASHKRIDELVRELRFDGYFETSAKEGWNISELTEAIKKAIDWDALPKVSSTALFQHIKDFLIAEKESGRLLATIDDLYHGFLKSGSFSTEITDLNTQFETCIGRVESRDLIRRLSFGNLVLLQPELLDNYASALINAVKDEPDGLGSIAEEKVRARDFPIPMDEGLKDKEQEKLLLIAMIEDLLRHEIVLREQADEGAYLVFPTQSTRENPDLADPVGKSVIFVFDGPVLNIYATLAVRLSHSGFFKKKETWKNAVTYTARVGGTCGLLLSNIGEGRGELTIFYDNTISEETRFFFEEYVSMHLQRRAIPMSIKRHRIFLCSNCGEPFTHSQVTLRRERGFYSIRCSVCDTVISILDRDEQLASTHQPTIHEMDRAADVQRDRETAKSIIQGKIATGDFDVFLCHSNKDKRKVKEIGENLKELGILPWLDEWELRPGFPWQRLLEQQIDQIRAVAVFVGEEGIGPWQDPEIRTFLREFASSGVPTIPILLDGASKIPDLPIFLEHMTWVDFRKQEPDPMKQLIWGITGERWSPR